MSRLFEITEALRDICSRAPENHGHGKANIYNELGAYELGVAAVSHLDKSKMTDHANTRKYRDMFIDMYRETYGYPTRVLCAVDGYDFNKMTSHEISNQHNRDLTRKFGKGVANAVTKKGEDYRNEKLGDTENDRINQVMDNGEMYVITVPEGKVLSHYIPGPNVLRRMKIVFNNEESFRSYISSRSKSINAALDALIQRMRCLNGVKFDHKFLKKSGGGFVNCEYELIDWNRVVMEHHFYGEIIDKMIKCGFLKLDNSVDFDDGENAEKRGVVNAAVESIMSSSTPSRTCLR